MCTFCWLCLFSLFLHFAARCGSIKIAPVSATNYLEEVEYATTKHRYLSVCVCVFRRPCSTAIFAQNLLATAVGQMNDSCCLQAVFVIDMVIVSKLYEFRLSTEKTMGKYLQSNFRLPAIWETCRCLKANTKCNGSMQNQSQPLFCHKESIRKVWINCVDKVGARYIYTRRMSINLCMRECMCDVRKLKLESDFLFICSSYALKSIQSELKMSFTLKKCKSATPPTLYAFNWP